MRRPWALPLVPLYAAGSALRWMGVAPKRLAWPVISVGNLSAGGAGKTPFTIALARRLSEAGVQVDVLSRGYGRTGTAVERVDPNGSAEQFGDEPLLIAQEAEIPVYVGASRFAAGTLAEQQSEASGASAASVPVPGLHLPRVHLLDDGFQHRQLARDIDIVLLNSDDLADHLLPAGNLREGLRALRRATVLAVPSQDEAAIRRIRELGLQQPLWRFERQMTVPAGPGPSIAGPVVAFCGIARPEQFFAGLEKAGVRLAARHAFRDHHRFTAADIGHLRQLLAQSGAAAFVTTEKDLVRLGSLGAQLREAALLHTARLRIAIEDAAAVTQWLLRKLPVVDPDSAL